MSSSEEAAKDWEASRAVEIAPDLPPVEIIPPGPMIYRKMVAAMRSIGAVTKDREFKVGEQVRYNFRGVDDVVNAVGPALREHGVFPVPEVLEIHRADTWTGNNRTDTKETRVRVRYTFYAEDGSSISAEVWGEGLDTSDKGVAKATSVAMRVVLLQVFQIPTDDPDPDAVRHERAGVGQMTKPVQTFIAEGIETGPVARLAELWQLIRAHNAADDAVPGYETTTWRELVARRVGGEVAAVITPEAGKELWTALTRAVLEIRVQDGGTERMVADVLKQRVAEIKRMWADTEKGLADDIVSAETPNRCMDLIGDILKAREENRLPEDRAAALADVARERMDKLERDALQAAQEATVAEAVPDMADVAGEPGPPDLNDPDLLLNTSAETERHR